MKAIVEWGLTGVYFDLWLHGAAPLAWPWDFYGPFVGMFVHFVQVLS